MRDALIALGRFGCAVRLGHRWQADSSEVAPLLRCRRCGHERSLAGRSDDYVHGLGVESWEGYPPFAETEPRPRR